MVFLAVTIALREDINALAVENKMIVAEGPLLTDVWPVLDVAVGPELGSALLHPVTSKGPKAFESESLIGRHRIPLKWKKDADSVITIV